MNAYEIPNLRFSVPCGGTVARRRFVTVDSSGKGILATSGHVIGVSMNEAKVGEVLEVADGIVIVEASAAIAAGANVSAAADGKAATTAADAVVVGKAITAATAAGQLISVKIG